MMFILALYGNIVQKDVMSKTLDLNEFIGSTTQRETAFESILSEKLKLAYRKDSIYPADDLLVRLKSEYQFYLDEGSNRPAITTGLSKLFPDSGSQLSVNYQYTPSVMSDSRSDFEVLFSQDIAENAFGKANRYLDELIDVENEVIEYQIVEAYEDYLASLIMLFMQWQAAFQKYRIGEQSYKKNEMLKENILEREKQKIALPIDVNKVSRLLLRKRESLTALGHDLALKDETIRKALRIDDPRIKLIPAPGGFSGIQVNDFASTYAFFTANSRTYTTMEKLEQAAGLNVNLAMDALLPSAQAFLGYRLFGKSSTFDEHENVVFGGVSLEWSFPDTQQKAKLALTEVSQKQQVLQNTDRRHTLKLQLKNLWSQIEYQKTLAKIAEEKIALSESILEDESKNYSLGKVTLNDYIDAVNNLDDSLFDQVEREAQYQILWIEFLRLTDQLVDKDLKPVTE